MSVCVLLSGGLDSMVVLSLLRTAHATVEACFIDYGQAASQHEKNSAEAIASHFGVPLQQLTFVVPKGFGVGEIKHRNGFLIYAAALASNCETIALGVHAGTNYPDCSKQFLEAIEVSLGFTATNGTRVLAPLKSWQKREIIAYAKQESLPVELSYSCEAGTMPPCGVCLSCRDRAHL